MTRRPPTRAEVALFGLLSTAVAISACSGLLRARMAGNEASALAALRNVAAAQVSYAATCGNGGFAATLVILGTPAEPGAAPFLSPPYGANVRTQNHGYWFEMGAGLDNVVGPHDCLPSSNRTNSTYYASAEPMAFGQTGARSFAVNRSAEVWQAFTVEAPREPFGSPETPVR